MNIIITAPSLDPNINVSGVSSVAKFIIDNNPHHHYIHIELGKRDQEGRGVAWGLRILIALLKYTLYILVRKAELVHFNYALSKASIVRDTPFIFIARLLRVKLIIHLHGGEFLMKEEMPSWIKSYLEYVLQGKETKIVLSELEKKVIEEKFAAKQVIALPNCVDLKEAAMFEKQPNTEMPLNILFMGRLTISKGIEPIVNALKNLKSKNIPFNFLVAGKGPEEQWFLQELQNNIPKEMHYCGVVKGNDKIALLKQCDVFLLPSLFGEGLPMALLEAMSFGLVPIVTDDGSMKFAVENGLTGVLVKKNSSQEIVDAIVTINSQRDRLKSLSVQTKSYIFDNFNPDKYIQNLNILYSSN